VATKTSYTASLFLTGFCALMVCEGKTSCIGVYNLGQSKLLLNSPGLKVVPHVTREVKILILKQGWGCDLPVRFNITGNK